MENLDRVLGQYYDIQEEMRILEARKQELSGMLDDLEPGTHEAGKWAVDIRAGRRFNEKAARSVLTQEELDLVLVKKVDGNKVKELGADRYAACQVESGVVKKVYKVED